MGPRKIQEASGHSGTGSKERAVLPLGSLGLRSNILVTAETVVWIVRRFDHGKPSVILGIGFWNTCRVILVQAVDIHRTGGPGFHGRVKLTRPSTVAGIFSRIRPRADQNQVEGIAPRGERRSIG